MAEATRAEVEFAVLNGKLDLILHRLGEGDVRHRETKDRLDKHSERFDEHDERMTGIEKKSIYQSGIAAGISAILAILGFKFGGFG